MTQFYASRYTTDGFGFLPIVGQLANENGREWGSIDLRPDVTVADGWALVAVDIARNPANLPAGVRHLGDTMAEAGQSARDFLANRFGITALADEPDLRRIVRRLLMAEGREDGTRWRPLLANALTRRYEIHLLGLVDQVPLVAGGAVATDDFNRADSTTLGGPSWTWSELNGDWTIGSNKLLSAALAANIAVRAEFDLSSSDNYAQAFQSAHSGTGDNNYAGPVCRFSASTFTGYCSTVRPNASTSARRLGRVVNWTYTSITTANGNIADFTHRIEVSGSTVTSYAGGAVLQTATDTNIVSGLRGGLCVIQSGGGSTRVYSFDDFETGDLAAAGVARSVAGVGSFPTSGAIAVPS